ncbi:MAG: hypothetical protein WCF16_04790 [Alphaproteobacteria bacterium]
MPQGAGGSRPVGEKAHLRFGFLYHGKPFSVLVSRRGEDGHLALSGNLGPLPFSAEASRERRAIRSILRRVGRFAHGRLYVGADHRIMVDAERRVGLPFVATDVIAALVDVILSAGDALERTIALLRSARKARPARVSSSPGV